jgi:hypothetical protein
MSRIRMTIGEISLKGFDRHEGRALIEGLKGELARVLSDPLTRVEWARSHRTPILRLGNAPLAAGSAGAGKFGRNMAHAIGKGLKP